MIPELQRGQVTSIFGPVSSGKTHLIRHWCRKLNRVVVFDYSGEFMESEEMEVIQFNPRALRERLQLNQYFFRIAYVPGRDPQLDFQCTSNVLWWTDIDKMLIVDEIHEVCPLNLTNGDMKMILKFARHDKLGLVGASQRIADVHKDFTSASRNVILFWTAEIRDLEAIEDRWRCANLVSNLKPLLRDDLTGQVHQIPQCVYIQRGQSPIVCTLEGI